MRKIVLASSSLRRRELQAQLHLDFMVAIDDYTEDHNMQLSPVALVRHLSREKARAVALKYPDSIIIAADTIGVIDGQIIGKPARADDAGYMLWLLSGKTHTVITAFTLLDTESKQELTRTAKTEVTFRNLSLAEIEAYVKTGEGQDKAGAYAIQGRGAIFIKEIKGEYTNVVGLPLAALAVALRKFGVAVL
jgi:septum formation protein